jgi:hypothetical protein
MIQHRHHLQSALVITGMGIVDQLAWSTNEYGDSTSMKQLVAPVGHSTRHLPQSLQRLASIQNRPAMFSIAFCGHAISQAEH